MIIKKYNKLQIDLDFKKNVYLGSLFLNSLAVLKSKYVFKNCLSQNKRYTSKNSIF